MTYLRFLVYGIVATSTVFTGLSRAQPAPPPGPAAPPAQAPGAAPQPGPPPPDAPPGSVPMAPGAGPPPGGGTTPFYEQAPQQQPATIHVAQPPPPPLEPRTRLYHDGFYFRFSTGFGYQGVSSSAGDSNVSTNGAGFALDIMIGGTPATGVVIGGGILGQTAVSPGQSSEGPVAPGLAAYPGGGVGLVVIGPFVDVFPNPTGGFHLGAELGIAGIGLKGNSDALSGGFGGSMWVGYMAWMSSQWSLGGLVRGTGAGTKRKIGSPEIDVSDGAWGLTFEFSTLYH